LADIFIDQICRNCISIAYIYNNFERYILFALKKK